MLKRQPYFILNINLVIIQQICLAISTYHIALAGESLAINSFTQIQYHLILFFAFALLAYFLSSCVMYSQVKLRNILWKDYVIDTLKNLGPNQNLSSKENRQKTISWMTGEAPLVFEEISQFSADILSLYCNIIFTLIVFSITLGFRITSIVASSLVFSVLIVSMLKNKIHTLADKIQNDKLNAFLKIPVLWDNLFFGNSNHIRSSKSLFADSAGSYFRQTEKYTILEQIIACLPIYITVPLIIIVLLTQNASYIVLGAFVAVLPRTLQLLGNVHALSIYNSRFLLILRKFKNLLTFSKDLEQQDLGSQINFNEIEISNLGKENKKILATDFIRNIINKNLPFGRYLMTGTNGAGKSTLLKFIKASFPEAILISPEASPGYLTLIGSTGEQQIKKIQEIFLEPSELYLLDEWDANLDNHNRIKIDNLIDKMKNTSIILEVRHI